MLTAIDHLIVAAPDVEAAAEPWRRLGFSVSARSRHLVGTENTVLMTGRDADSMFYVEFLGAHDRDATAAMPRGQRLIDSIQNRPGALRIMFAVDDLDAITGRLTSAGIAVERAEVRREDGDLICHVAVPEDTAPLACDVGFIHYAVARPAQFAAREQRGAFTHEFALCRLDHLAVIAPRLDETAAAWEKLAGVPVFGEVRGRGMLIKQLKIGDAIVELLGPDSPESPLASRPPGLISMAAFEVEDLEAAVASARARGFTLGDPAPGVLPGTRTATIPGDQLSGLGLQILEYV